MTSFSSLHLRLELYILNEVRFCITTQCRAFLAFRPKVWTLKCVPVCEFVRALF